MQLIVAPHTAAELVSRMVAAEFVTKTGSRSVHLRFDLALTPKASALLSELTKAHLRELDALQAAVAARAPGPS